MEPEPGWLGRQLENVQRDVATWPEWMKKLMTTEQYMDRPVCLSCVTKNVMITEMSEAFLTAAGLVVFGVKAGPELLDKWIDLLKRAKAAAIG